MAVLAVGLRVYLSNSVVYSFLVVVSLNFCFFLNWFVSITLHTLTGGMYSVVIVVAVVVRRGAVVVIGVVSFGALVVGGILIC